MTPCDLRRLAVRIETLQRTHTHGWMPGDDLEFQNSLPGGRDPRSLPDPRELREMADHRGAPDSGEATLWVATIMRLEGLAHRNNPHNPRRIIHDMARGKIPFRR